jgi:hypothetical protein
MGPISRPRWPPYSWSRENGPHHYPCRNSRHNGGLMGPDPGIAARWRRYSEKNWGP